MTESMTILLTTIGGFLGLLLTVLRILAVVVQISRRSARIETNQENLVDITKDHEIRIRKIESSCPMRNSA
jgi:hypothetical protein